LSYSRYRRRGCGSGYTHGCGSCAIDLPHDTLFFDLVLFCLGTLLVDTTDVALKIALVLAARFMVFAGLRVDGQLRKRLCMQTAYGSIICNELVAAREVSVS
jgi:hypothetical protein